MLRVGIRGDQKSVVKEKDTAIKVGSGEIEVLSTPSMISLMEKTAYESVQNYISDGTTTVGVSISVKHICPTPVGNAIRCESELIEIDGKNLVFEVMAYDDFGMIGKGIHERRIVDSQYFMMKALLKSSGHSN